MTYEAYTGDQIAQLDPPHKAILSGKLIHGLYKDKILNSDDIAQIANTPLLSLGDKAEQFLNYWANKYRKPGKKFTFTGPKAREAVSSAYAEDSEELYYIIKYMLINTQEWLSNPESITYESGHIKGSFMIAPKGWAHLSYLKQSNQNSKIVFCAMWFDQTTQAYYNIVKEIVEKLGYDCKRIDLVDHNNKICDEIVKYLKTAKCVIADFTGHRGGVYYEAGFAHGRNIPVIFTCRDDCFEGRHFDIRQYNCIKWFNDNLEQFESQLENRILAQIET